MRATLQGGGDSAGPDAGPSDDPAAHNLTDPAIMRPLAAELRGAISLVKVRDLTSKHLKFRNLVQRNSQHRTMFSSNIKVNVQQI
jgi:hypothetical protein